MIFKKGQKVILEFTNRKRKKKDICLKNYADEQVLKSISNNSKYDLLPRSSVGVCLVVWLLACLQIILQSQFL